MRSSLPLLGLLMALSACGDDDTTPADAGTEVDAGGGAVDAGPPDAGFEPLPPCGTEGPAALAACVDRERFEADLAALTATPDRSPGTAGHAAARALCAERLAELGYEVEEHDYGTGVNVVGTRPGTTTPDEWVLISAHYDSVRSCPGADDNASGTAGVLEAARVLSMVDTPRTVVLACWDEEERGLVGSTAYADRLAMDSSTTLVANYVFEMIAYRDDTPGSQTLPTGFDLLFPHAERQLEAREWRGDFIALIYDELESSEEATLMASVAGRVGLPLLSLNVTEDLKLLDLTADLRRSDHAGFWYHDDPGMMITDTANFRYPRYHCADGPDVVEVLDTGFATKVVATTTGAAAASLGL